jgi:hypothetical protein
MYVGWGEKEGLLTNKFKEPPYPYYESQVTAGNLYTMWNEFGKTPYVYWTNQDLNNPIHFMANCRSHQTFRAQFILCVRSYNCPEFHPDFYTWFDQYRIIWEAEHGIGWTPTYDQGGVLLATTTSNYDFNCTVTVKSVVVD